MLTIVWKSEQNLWFVDRWISFFWMVLKRVIIFSCTRVLVCCLGDRKCLCVVSVKHVNYCLEKWAKPVICRSMNFIFWRVDVVVLPTTCHTCEGVAMLSQRTYPKLKTKYRKKMNCLLDSAFWNVHFFKTRNKSKKTDVFIICVANFTVSKIIKPIWLNT